MKQFLINTALFALAILATLAIGEWLVRRTPNPYATKNECVLRDGKEITVAILGSSHTFYGVVADSLGSDAVNLANVSQNYEYDLRILRRYEEQLPALRKVVIPVSYFSFFDPPFEESSEKWYQIYYRIYMGIDKYPLLSPYGFELSDLSVYAGKLRGIFGGKRRGLCSPRGFGLDFSLEDRDPMWQQSAGRRVAHHTASDSRYIGYNLASLDALLDYCLLKGIEPHLITTPTWEGYRALLDPAQLATTRRLTDSIARSRGIGYTDFSADPRFIDEDFHDPDHLSDRGALRLTRILADSILSK